MTTRAELAKWGWLTFVLTVLVIVVYAVPWIPGKIKILLAVPAYAMFVLLFYKYIALKKAPAVTIVEPGAEQTKKPGSRKKRKQSSKK